MNEMLHIEFVRVENETQSSEVDYRDIVGAVITAHSILNFKERNGNLKLKRQTATTTE